MLEGREKSRKRQEQVVMREGVLLESGPEF